MRVLNGLSGGGTGGAITLRAGRPSNTDSTLNPSAPSASIGKPNRKEPELTSFP